MKYLSICSGIEAATVAWEPLGWRPVAFSEIEAFPSAVLAHHYPNVPNLGDMTAPDFVSRARALGPIDAIVGGTPCQSWSVAGKRGGKDDPRGMLTFRFLQLVEEIRPEWVVWENVPGIISQDGGKPFSEFLDYLLGLGYSINCDILDAQFFGLAQRRRRVFVVCQRADILIQQRTLTSSLTLVNLIGEVLLDTLDVLTAELGSGRAASDTKCASAKDGLRRKMMCYSKGGAENWATWLRNSEEVLLNAHHVPVSSESRAGHITKTLMDFVQTETDTRLSGSSETKEKPGRGAYSNTVSSQKIFLDEAYTLANASTISTETNKTTDQKIFSYLEMLVRIGARILPSKEDSEHYWIAGSSILTAMKEYIKYARSTDGEILVRTGVFKEYSHLVRQAMRLCESFGCTGKRPDTEQVFPLAKGLRRDTPPSREAGQGFAHDVAPCIGASGRGFERGGDTSGQDPVVASLHTNKGRPAGRQSKHTEMVSVKPLVETLTTDGHARSAVCITGPITHALKADGFDASEDGTGRGQPMVACFQQSSMKGKGTIGWDDSGVAKPVKTQMDGQMICQEVADTSTNCFHKHHGASGGRDCLPRNHVACFGGSNASGPIDVATARNARDRLDFETETFAVALRGRDGGTTAELGDDCGHALRASGGGGDKPHVLSAMQVRRLTPRECERLQGFPDDYTLIPWRCDIKSWALNKTCPDGPRYKALGNSMAVPCMRWIGLRIMKQQIPGLEDL